jgi:hypothetical protein
MSSRHSPKAAVRAAHYFVLASREAKFAIRREADSKRLAHLPAVRSALRALQLRSVKIETDFLAARAMGTTTLSLHRGIKRSRNAFA